MSESQENGEGTHEAVNILRQKLVSVGILPRDGKFNVPSIKRETQYKQMKEVAIQNMEYYLQKAQKTGLSWHKCAKQDTQYSEFVYITPEMGVVALESSPGNRRIRKATVDGYRRDVRNDRWVLTDESIGFDADLDLYNGHHRLTAVVLEETPAVFYVTFNVPVQARFVVDSGAKRSTSDKLGLVMENPLGTKLPAIARSMMRGAASGPSRYTDTEVAEFVSKYSDIIHWAVRSCPKVRSDVSAAIAKAAIWYGEKAVESFCKQLTEKVFPTVNSPAKRLYEVLLRAKSGGASGSAIYSKSLAALDHHIRGAEVKALYEREGDLFDWSMPGWNVPANKKK